jgi:hypothetical protein
MGRFDDLFGGVSEGIIFSPDDFQDLDMRIAEMERDIRPNKPGIIQLQMDDLDSYTVYIYPDIVQDFYHPDHVRAFLIRHTHNEGWTDKLLSMAASFKLANLDVDTGRVVSVSGYSRIL